MTSLNESKLALRIFITNRIGTLIWHKSEMPESSELCLRVSGQRQIVGSSKRLESRRFARPLLSDTLAHGRLSQHLQA